MSDKEKPDQPSEQPGPPSEEARKSSTTEAIVQLGQTTVPTAESNIFCLTIIGQIEGHLILPPQNKTTKYEHVIPQLIAAEQNAKIEGLLIVLNTVGGDVEAGLAIAEMICYPLGLLEPETLIPSFPLKKTAAAWIGRAFWLGGVADIYPWIPVLWAGRSSSGDGEASRMRDQGGRRLSMYLLDAG